MFKRILQALKIVRVARTTKPLPATSPQQSWSSIFRTRARKARPEPIPNNIAPSIYYSIVGAWHEIYPSEEYRERLRKLYETPEEGEAELLDEPKTPEEAEEREIREIEKREIKEVEERHNKQREEREIKKREEREVKERAERLKKREGENLDY